MPAGLKMIEPCGSKVLEFFRAKGKDSTFRSLESNLHTVYKDFYINNN
jgi:hypothetical protein